jgi:hypothetical protein
MNPSIRIGRQHQLFLDNFLIASCEGVTRRVCPVAKHPANPVIRPTELWEPEGYITYGSVIYDAEERVYKAWCQGVGGSLDNITKLAGGGVFHFASDDGIAWRKQLSDAVQVEGKPSHIVSLWSPGWPAGEKPPYYELFGAFKDEGEPDPARRYKLGFLYLKRDYYGPGEHPRHKGQLRGLGVAFSPDGVHWEALAEPVTQATSDGATHWFRDPDTGHFVMYGRGRHIAPAFQAKYEDDPRFVHHGGRAVRRAESADFLHWEPADGQIVLAADTEDGPGDDIYGMNVFPYAGIYIGLVQVFHNYPERAWLEIQLAVSRDSIHFERLNDRAPFIPVGGIGAWDRFNNSLATNPPHRVGDELRFYYGGRNYVHGGACKGADNGSGAGLSFRAGVGVGTVPLDRFCAMEATFDTGVLRTKPLLLDGRRLHLNAEAPFGRIGVALLRSDGTEITASAVQEKDGVDLPVDLELSGAAEEPVVVEFRITNARLFAFWVD